MINGLLRSTFATTDQMLDKLPSQIKTLITIARLELSLNKSNSELELVVAHRQAAEAALSYEPEDRHFDILCKIIGLTLIESLLPSN